MDEFRFLSAENLWIGPLETLKQKEFERIQVNIIGNDDFPLVGEVGPVSI
jgi:hypothetical protein